jgi:hypothetical protein
VKTPISEFILGPLSTFHPHTTLQKKIGEVIVFSQITSKLTLWSIQWRRRIFTGKWRDVGSLLLLHSILLCCVCLAGGTEKSILPDFIGFFFSNPQMRSHFQINPKITVFLSNWKPTMPILSKEWLMDSLLQELLLSYVLILVYLRWEKY